MSVQVQVKQGYIDVWFPDGYYHSQGDVFTLSDVAYANLPGGDLSALTTNIVIAPPPNTPYTPPPADPNATINLTVANNRFEPLNENTVALFGDSITFNHGVLGGGFMFGRGYFSWANSLMGHRFKVTYIDGVGGSSIMDANILTTRVPALIASGAAWAIIEFGTNDIAGGQPAAYVQAAFTGVINAIRSAGMKVVVLTVPPRNTFTTGQRAVWGQVNTWLRQLAWTQSGVLIADIASYLTDPANAQPANYISGYTLDGIHPSIPGAIQCGKAIAAAMGLVSPSSSIILPQSDSANLIPYSASTFAGGASVRPTSWFGSTSGNISYSQVQRPDSIPGVLQQVIQAPGASQTLIVVPSGWNVGDNLIAYLEFWTNNPEANPAANSQRFNITLQTQNSSFAVLNSASDCYADSSYENGAPLSSGVFVTPTLTVPAGTSTMYLYIAMFGGATYQLGRVGIAKVIS